nr:immunoglobulin light chain junction region [Macaca mulatta]MOX09470.1 immunoglobulin light chain junction region [Macaca mulatta]MOX09744.1 immunoglobulin light chain junction region [Macaca mulatta]MOX10402.1 immunoglobulin light chain junction region [Macaca mulatta]MOX10611.1 immunoglobulin light chain junction region [Macaca mulatta]
CLQSLEFPFTF